MPIIGIEEVEAAEVAKLRDFSPIISQAEDIIRFIDSYQHSSESRLQHDLQQWSFLKRELDKDTCYLQTVGNMGDGGWGLAMHPIAKQKKMQAMFKAGDDCRHVNFAVIFYKDHITLRLHCFMPRARWVEVWKRQLPIISLCHLCGKYKSIEGGKTLAVDLDPGDPEVGPMPDIQDVWICQDCIKNRV